MNYSQNETVRRLGSKPKTRKLILTALLFSLVAFVCLKLSQRAEASVTVTRTGVAPNFVVTFTNDGTAPVDNRLELHFNGADQLEYSVNGGAFTNNLGGGNTATFANIATIVTNFGPGSNSLVLNLQQFAFNVSVAPDFGNSQQTDITLTDTGTFHSVTVNTTSAKVIHFTGGGGNDNLTVSPGQGDSTARIDNGATVFTDEVKASDLQPLLEFEQINTFTYQDAGIGTNVVTFATQNLAGANSYNASLDSLDALVIEGADAINDNYTITRPGAGQVRVTDNTPAPPVAVTLAQSGGGSPPALRVNGLGGNDTLNINVGAGSDVIPNAITFDGGTGNDLLEVFGAPATAVDNVIQTPGPTSGEGHLRYNNGGGTQLMSVDYLNTEAAADLVTAAKLTANATDGANAINYSAAQIIGSGGRVSVDSFAPLEFSNKTNLIINGLAGSDLINLNNVATPQGLTGTITVNGGDPTASDTLIVNSEGRNLILEPTALGAGTVTYFGGGLPSTPFTGIEHLELVDTAANPFGIDGTTGNDQFEYIPGVTPDTGTLVGTMNSGVAQFPLVPVTFIGMQQAGVVVFNAFGQQGGTDSFVFDGTPANDNVSLTNGGVFGGVTLSDTVNGTLFANLNLTNMASASLQGNDGDDVFTHDGNVPIAVTYSGGSHSVGDVLNYTARNNAATTIDLGVGTINSTGSGAVNFIGIQTVNETSSGASPTLTVNGTSSGDNITFTPTGSKAGTVTLVGLAPQINFTGLSALTLNGADGNDFFNITPSSTVAVNVNGGNPTPPASPGDSISVNTLGTTGFALSNLSTPSGLTGAFTFSNRMTVNFQQIETLSPLFVSAATINATEGLPVSNATVATFSAAALPPSNFTATINWGDGTSSSTGTVASPASGSFTVAGSHNFSEEGTFDVSVKVTDLTTGATQQVTSTAKVADAPLSVAVLTPGVPTTFSGVGGNNTSTTAGTANAALTSFTAAIGGVNNGATPSPQANGFRAINWDAVALDGTDFGGTSTTIVANFVVGIPNNRFQERGSIFGKVSAVSGPASNVDPSTFTTVNGGVANKFPGFSPKNTFAPFNDNKIDVFFTLPSDHKTPAIGAVTRGFGAVFLNVQNPNTTSIEYFSGTTSLGKFFVPTGASSQAEFFGVLFQNPVVTNVHIELGNATLFSFDGTNVTSGPADSPPGTNLVVNDDFVYAEPIAISTGIDVNATVGTSFTAKLASFTDADPNGQSSDYSVVISWGDGTTSAGGVGPNSTIGDTGTSSTFDPELATITPNINGGFDVTGTHTYTTPGTFTVTTSIRDVGGASISANSIASVSGTAISGSFQFNAPTTSVGEAAGSVTLTVTRTGDTSGAASVNFETSDGTASQKNKYIFNSGNVQFGPGDASKTIKVLLVNEAFVEGNQTFLVTLSNPSPNFVIGGPGVITVTIFDDDTVAPVTNPIDDATFFVRQHYLDFLGREPDTPGLNFWVGQITACGANPSCISNARVNVSAAFFLSIEFQETSGNVIRTQRVAFGKQSGDSSRVPYLQFMRDTRQVGAGVIVGQPGFDTLLESNKQAYALQIVNSPAFLLRVPIMPAAPYVDALYASAGLTPTPADRSAAITAFGAGGTLGRVAALRSVADSNSLRQAELNPSFVLAEYYGYLRRNPTDAPDFSDAGYQFWLTKLNSFNGNFVQAEMVKAFITSAEYRQRFGPP